MLLLIWQFSFFCMGTVFGGVITLRKDNTITCVLTEGDINSGVYLWPSSNKSAFKNSSPDTTKIMWIPNDWMQNNSRLHSFKPITDSRWTTLPWFNIDTYKPPPNKFNQSFSACFPKSDLGFSALIRPKGGGGKWIPANFNVSASDTIPEADCSWVHFTVYNKDGSVALLDDLHEDIHKELTANSWFRFHQFPTHLVKQHFYKFLWSNTTTTEPSKLLLLEGNVCVDFYVSIDRDCMLEITLKDYGKTVNVTRVDGHNIPGELKSWKYMRIESASSSKVNLYFVRKKNSTSSTGYWAIDHVRDCSNNAAIYTTTLDQGSEQARCQVLKKDSNRKRGFLNHNKVGCLGTRNCEVNCTAVLGDQFESCQKHTICQDGNSCYCAWGYTGETCSEQCSNGTWGMDCLNECNQNCSTSCNTRNGTCEDIYSMTSFKADPPAPNNDNTTPIITTTTTNTRPSSTTNLTPKLTTTIKLTATAKNTTTSKNTTPSKITTISKLTATTKTITNSSISTIPTPNTWTILNSPYFVYSFLGFFLLIILLTIYIYIYRYVTNRRVTGPPDLGQPKVSVLDFEQYIKRSLTERILVNQFNTLTNEVAECNAALEYRNIRKNYDRNNIPYDQNRVVLERIDDADTHDYINASYINGWGRSKAYIVTQGPKSVTIPDFWRMVWQHDLRTIVMATNFRENMKRKCVEYFPLYLNASLLFGEFGIKLVKEECHEYYNKRILEVYYNRYHKVVTHYQMTWKPDLDRPLYPNDLVPLVQIMNENYGNANWTPVLVHCSLGVERSALLILCDIAFQMAKTEGYVDMYELAKMLREQRRNMITSSQDYILAHLVTSECLMSEDKLFLQLDNSLDDLSVNRQLESLNTFAWHDNVVKDLMGVQSQSIPFVRHLNRYGDELKYFYTKQPKTNSLAFFWLTVLRQEIKTILFLNEYDFKPWPFRQDLSEREVCTVRHVESFRTSKCIASKLIIEERDVRTTTLYRADILFIELLGWQSNSLETRISTTNILIQCIEDIRNLDPAPNKLLVCCLDGRSDCGLFIAMSFVIRKYLREVFYDVPNAIRSLRRSNLAFPTRPDDVRILHEAILTYAQMFDPYNNIDTDAPLQ